MSMIERMAALIEEQGAIIRALVDELAQHEAVTAWAEKIAWAEKEREELL